MWKDIVMALNLVLFAFRTRYLVQVRWRKVHGEGCGKEKRELVNQDPEARKKK